MGAMNPMEYTQPPCGTQPKFEDTSLLKLIADSVPALMAYFEANSWCCRFANARYAAYNGHTTESIVGQAAPQIIGATAWLVALPQVLRVAQGESVQYVREHFLPDGTRRIVEVSLQPHFEGVGRLQHGFFVLINDITERWQTDQAIRHSEERMRKFAQVSHEAILFHGTNGIVDCNDALLHLLGYQREQLLGVKPADLLSERYRAMAIDYLHKGSEHFYEATVLHSSGREVPVEIAGKTIADPTGDYRVAVLHDITERKQAQKREAFLALHDRLTQLPNRRHLMELMDKAVAQAKHSGTLLAVLFVNLDHFKTINDSLGHQAGDQLLCAMAERLRSSLHTDDLVARLGGDEFVAVLPSVGSHAVVSAVAETLLNAISDSITIDNVQLSVSSSIGISVFPEDGDHASDLLRHADAAMHHVKENGRASTQFYAHGMAAGAMEVLLHEHLLRGAIASDAFVLHYQPQVRLYDGTLVGFEALVRWQHPERGLVGPDEFIAFAELRGLITPIGRWVMREACRQTKAWQDAGLGPLHIAVNLSALEFRQRDMAAEIAHVLQSTGLEPRFLEVELTESVLMHPTAHRLNTLSAIKALGVNISIDDFGTGYSSLAYLKRYPIDKLKIDRSFITDTPDNPEDVAIVTTIVQLGRNLQLQTVAEGVETPQQMALLRSLGCDLAQGYGVSPPLSADQAVAWMHEWRHEAPCPI